jgi:hypothetical protein
MGFFARCKKAGVPAGRPRSNRTHRETKKNGESVVRDGFDDEHFVGFYEVG